MSSGNSSRFQLRDSQSRPNDSDFSLTRLLVLLSGFFGVFLVIAVVFTYRCYKRRARQRKLNQEKGDVESRIDIPYSTSSFGNSLAPPNARARIRPTPFTPSSFPELYDIRPDSDGDVKNPATEQSRWHVNHFSSISTASSVRSGRESVLSVPVVVEYMAPSTSQPQILTPGPPKYEDLEFDRKSDRKGKGKEKVVEEDGVNFDIPLTPTPNIVTSFPSSAHQEFSRGSSLGPAGVRAF
ncbi:hypothetical protein C8Q75DRAFT_805863 [Abortiporus biennis]|nr:hypothetical protein C8Q75DRAFT_805863 [Abortiporus biennis]